MVMWGRASLTRGGPTTDRRPLAKTSSMQPLPFVSGHLLFRRASISSSSTHPYGQYRKPPHTKYGVLKMHCVPLFPRCILLMTSFFVASFDLLSLVCSDTTCCCVGAGRPIYIFSASQASQCYGLNSTAIGRVNETGEEDDMLVKFVGKVVGDHKTAITEIAGEQLVVNTRWQHYFETVGGNPYLTPIWSEWAIQRPIRLYISML